MVLDGGLGSWACLAVDGGKERGDGCGFGRCAAVR